MPPKKRKVGEGVHDEDKIDSPVDLISEMRNIIKRRPDNPISDLEQRLQDAESELKRAETNKLILINRLEVLKRYAYPVESPQLSSQYHKALLDLATGPQSPTSPHHNRDISDAWRAIQPIARSLIRHPKTSLAHGPLHRSCEVRIQDEVSAIREIPPPFVLGGACETTVDAIASDLQSLLATGGTSVPLSVASLFLSIISQASLCDRRPLIYSEILLLTSRHSDSGQGVETTSLSDSMRKIALETESCPVRAAIWACVSYGEVFASLQIIRSSRLVCVYGSFGDANEEILQAITSVVQAVWSEESWSSLFRPLFPSTITNTLSFLLLLHICPNTDSLINTSLLPGYPERFPDSRGVGAPRDIAGRLPAEICAYILDDLDHTVQVWRDSRAGKFLLIASGL